MAGGGRKAQSGVASRLRARTRTPDTRGSIGICGPLLVRTICQGDMVSCVSPFGGGDMAPPLRGDGCSPGGGPPGRRRDAQGRAASVAWAHSLATCGLWAVGFRPHAERAALGPPRCGSSWFPRGWYLSLASRCCTDGPFLVLRSKCHIWQQKRGPTRVAAASVDAPHIALR